MNAPPSTYIRVPHEAISDFVSQAAQKVGLPAEKADLLAQLLTENDLRGVFSHGSRQIATYAILMRDGKLNNNPQPFVVETPVSLLMDGDGGLGYFPTYEGTLRLIEKAEQSGIAVLQTRNHGHFGAAGIYSRLPLSHGLITYVTSGHQLKLEPDQSLFEAAGGSPMSFSAPTLEEDPIVLDFGAIHDMYASSPHRDEIVRLAPGTALRSIGMGIICQAWGGMLAGVPLDEERAVKQYPGANQGSLVITFRADLFQPAEQFRREMDEYVRRIHSLRPLEGFDRSYPPGGVEAARDREYRQRGIPVGPEHQQKLEEVAKELGLQTPWQTGQTSMESQRSA